MPANAAQWVAEHKVGKHVEEAISKLIKMDPRPQNPIEVLGNLLIESAHEKGAPYIEHVPTTASEPAVEAHQKSEVDDNVATLRACAVDVLATMSGITIRCTRVTTVPKDIPSGAKLVHFIRHGEGTHNVAQREWRADPQWDGKSEPYTIDNDPEYGFVDAELNEKGRGQATALQQATASLAPELLVVSPMRRATLTGLLAFEAHIERGELPVVAHEFCHERAGRHTCDKRLPKAELAALYPKVSYDLVEGEEDPYWGDGVTREPWRDLGVRAGAFASWLLDRPEAHVAVAAHSAILLALFNAVLECDDEDTRKWFGTGEMRTVMLSRDPQGSS